MKSRLMKKELIKGIVFFVCTVVLLVGCGKKNLDTTSPETNNSKSSDKEACNKEDCNKEDCNKEDCNTQDCDQKEGLDKATNGEDKNEECTNKTSDNAITTCEAKTCDNMSKANKETPTVTEVVQLQNIADIIYQSDFEKGTDGFITRAEEVVALSTENPHAGKSCLAVTRRSQAWNGAKLDVTSLFEVGKTYHISAYVKSEKAGYIYCTTEVIPTKGETKYINVSTIQVKDNEWILMEMDYTYTELVKTLYVYFESSHPTANMYVDDVIITKAIEREKVDMNPSLCNSCDKYFSLGLAVNEDYFKDPVASELINYHFNSITPENDFKPEVLLRQEESAKDLKKYNEAPCIDYSYIDRYLTYAKEHDFKVRFHTLLWYRQTPRWFFAEGYSTAEDAKLVSKELMLKRMDNYIKNIMGYVNKNYPGVVYAWDVVNEAIADETGSPNGYRNTESYWFETCGEGYVEAAFAAARKYAAKDTKLFYNDYNEVYEGKLNRICKILTNLKQKGLVDGIGMQSHHILDTPPVSQIESAILKYASLGLEIQFTELDLDTRKNDEATMEIQAKRYADIFDMLLRLDQSGKADITNVSFWGLIDSRSWLNGFHNVPEYPLLFDGDYNVKPAFFAVIEVMKKYQ